MRLRQVVWVARDLERVVDELRVSLGLDVCHRDPGVATFGLHNALLPVGDGFLEVVAPLHEGTPAGRFLERRGGDGGYMVLIQVDDLARERARLDAAGVRVVWEGSGEQISGMHLHPADVGAAIVSFDVAEPADSWGWAGPDWRAAVHSDVVSGIAGVEIQADEPARLAERWSTVLDRPLGRGPDGTTIALDGGTVRVVAAADGRGDGLSGVDLVASDRRRAGECMDIGGVRVRLV